MPSRTNNRGKYRHSQGNAWVILMRVVVQGEDSLGEFSVPKECSQRVSPQASVLSASGKKKKKKCSKVKELT